MLARLRGSLRHTAWSTRLLAGGLALTLAFTAIAAAARLRPPVTAPVYVVLALALWTLALARARFDRGVVVILVAGLGLYLAYLGYTDYGERNYDGAVQLQYIEYLVAHHARPPAAHCLICHHPPLYYALGAGVFAFFKATGLAAPTTGLQIFSLLLFLVFLAYGVRTAALFVTTKRDLRLAAALITFWPYSVHNCCRLHNDSLVSTLMAVALYFLVLWSRDDRPRHLYLGALFTALALLTKSSALVLVAVLLVLLAVRFFPARDKLRFLARAGAVALLLTGAVALNARGKERPASASAPLCHQILGNACDINQGQLLPNAPINYLYLDLRSFLEEPYALADREGSGRQYFWNHLLKSSLFGTHNTVPDPRTSYRLNRGIAEIMNVALLGMLAYLALGAISVRSRALRKWGVLLLSLASSGVFMVGFRFLIPAPHHSDFRHVFPAVIPLAAIYAATVAHFRARELALEHVGLLLAVPFLVLSIVYFLPKCDLSIRLTRHTVTRALDPYSRPVPEGTPWDKATNLRIEEDEIVEFALPAGPTVSELDVSLDGNDRYAIELVGETSRTVVVGPVKKAMIGLGHYTERVDPPVARVRTIRLRPLSGDGSYAMGHLMVR
jgi:predicted membrane-bound mannosyltransferase